MNEGGVFEALKTRYNSPEYCLLPQVRNSTGYSSKVRTADAIAMSLWPSRGLTLTGFEAIWYLNREIERRIRESDPKRG